MAPALGAKNNSLHRQGNRVEKEKGFREREGSEGGWAWRHGMVWAEHPGRRPPSCNSNKIVACEHPRRCCTPFYLFPFFVVSSMTGTLPVSLSCTCVSSKILTWFKVVAFAEDDFHSLRTLQPLCYLTLFAFSIYKVPCVSKIFTKSVAVLYGGEGWEGRVLGEELQQGETIKRVPRMWL